MLYNAVYYRASQRNAEPMWAVGIMECIILWLDGIDMMFLQLIHMAVLVKWKFDSYRIFVDIDCDSSEKNYCFWIILYYCPVDFHRCTTQKLGT